MSYYIPSYKATTINFKEDHFGWKKGGGFTVYEFGEITNYTFEEPGFFYDHWVYNISKPTQISDPNYIPNENYYYYYDYNTFNYIGRYSTEEKYPDYRSHSVTNLTYTNHYFSDYQELSNGELIQNYNSITKRIDFGEWNPDLQGLKNIYRNFTVKYYLNISSVILTTHLGEFECWKTDLEYASIADNHTIVINGTIRDQLIYNCTYKPFNATHINYTSLSEDFANSENFTQMKSRSIDSYYYSKELGICIHSESSYCSPKTKQWKTEIFLKLLDYSLTDYSYEPSSLNLSDILNFPIESSQTFTSSTSKVFNHQTNFMGMLYSSFFIPVIILTYFNKKIRH